MNKAELVQALAERLDGDRKVATAAVDGLLDVIVRTVHSGDAVSVTGFGVFERRERAARSARNPRTGQLIEIAATAVPAFRPGAMFRDVVSGARPLEAAAPRSPRMDRPRSTADAAGAVNGVVNGAVAPVPEAAVEVPAVTANESKPVKAAKAVKASKPSKVPKSTKPEPKSVKASKNADKDKGKKKGKK